MESAPAPVGSVGAAEEEAALKLVAKPMVLPKQADPTEAPAPVSNETPAVALAAAEKGANKDAEEDKS
jgi:hypothetical protein